MNYRVKNRGKFIQIESWNDDENPIIETIDKSGIFSISVEDNDDGWSLIIYSDPYSNEIFSSALDEDFEIVKELYDNIMSVICN